MPPTAIPTTSALRGLLGLASSQYKSGKLKEAAETFARFLDQFPNHPSAVETALARGQILEKLGSHDAALAMYRRVLDQKAKPEVQHTALLAAARLHARGNQNDEAAALYKRLGTEFPKATDADAALYEWAWIERSRGGAAAAMALWTRLHDEHRSSRLWSDATYRIAQHALESKDFDRAAKLAAEILDGNHADAGALVPHVLYLQGQIAVARQQWSEVSGPLEKLLSEHADHALALAAAYWIAEADYRQQRYVEAGRRLDELDKKLAWPGRALDGHGAAAACTSSGPAIAMERSSGVGCDDRKTVPRFRPAI